MNKNLALTIITAATILIAGTALAQGADAPKTPTLNGNAGHAPQAGTRIRPAAAGKVTAISGSTLTIAGQGSAVYTIDASAAKITKGIGANAQVIGIADISTGDTIEVFGAASGNNITATSITLNDAILGRGNLAAGSNNNTLANLQARADKEIDNRVEALNAQLTRLAQMVRLTETQKSALQTSEQGVITTLTALKAKIDADTDMAILKTDVQSITKSERVYMLVVPQTAILSAADRINTVATMLSGIQAKLASRLAALPAGGSNPTLNSDLSDMQAQINNALTEAQSATSDVANLQADNGVQSTLAANNVALKNARAKIVNAQKDLKAAQKDARDILQGLKSASGADLAPINAATSTPTGE